MKKIKLFSMFTIILVGLFFMTGCGQKNVEGTLEEIMTKLYAEIPENERPMMLMNTDLTEMDKETISGFIGTADIDFKQILASESGVGSIAHSVVLVRMNEKADVTAAAEAIKAKVNPRKWVSRLCMILLHKAHVGETQSSIWPEEMRKVCKEAGMPLI